jgi:hypothetical protein
MPRLWPGAGTSRSPGKQLELAVDRDVPHAGRVDPLANGVVVLAARVVELPTLDVDRLAGEEVVAAAVVEVQVCVDDHVDAGEIEVLLAQRLEAGIHVGHQRVQLRHAGVDQHARIGMVDDVRVDRHPVTLDEQLGEEERRDGGRDGGRRRHPMIVPQPLTMLNRGRAFPRPHEGHPPTLAIRWRRAIAAPSIGCVGPNRRGIMGRWSTGRWGPRACASKP